MSTDTPNDLPRLFVLGDSISLQYGPALEQAVKGVFAYSRKQGLAEAMTNLDIPAGANGGDSSNCLAFLRTLQAHSEFRADVILLNCGLHDIKTDPDSGAKQVSPEAYRDNLEEMVNLIREWGIKLVWVTTTPVDEATHNTEGMDFHRYNADVDERNAIASSIMAKADVPVLDLHRYSMALGDPTQTLCDGRHFHEAIRLQQGAFIAGWLTSWWRTASTVHS